MREEVKVLQLVEITGPADAVKRFEHYPELRVADVTIRAVTLGRKVSPSRQEYLDQCRRLNIVPKEEE